MHVETSMVRFLEDILIDLMSPLTMAVLIWKSILRLATTGPLPQGRELSMFVQGPARQPYIPPASLWERSNLPNLFGNHVQNRHKKALKEEVRLSSATLELITHAHRVLSEETHTLGLAAADLFRRCERLQDELRDQIERVKDVSRLVDTATGTRSGRGDVQKGPQPAVEQRLEHVQARQGELRTRMDKLSKKVRLYNRTPLSDQEKAFFGEITKINQSVPDTVETDDQDNGEAPPELQHRYDEVSHHQLNSPEWADALDHRQSASPPIWWPKQRNDGQQSQE